MTNTNKPAALRNWIVIVDRAVDGAPIYAGELDGTRCGVRKLDNASRFTKIGAKRVLSGFAQAAALGLAIAVEVSNSGGLTDEPERVGVRLGLGGTGQRELTFLVKTTEEERAEVRAQVAAIKPYRKRTHRPDYARGRARMEAAGAAAVVAEDQAKGSSARCWLVRIYYISAGDELLCFDAGPYVSAVASRVASENAQPEVYVPPAGKTRRKDEPMYKSATEIPQPEAFKRDEIGADAIAQGCVRRPAAGARLVRLPSQSRDGYEYSCAECRELEGCQPDCSVAPWNIDP